MKLRIMYSEEAFGSMKEKDVLVPTRDSLEVWTQMRNKDLPYFKFGPLIIASNLVRMVEIVTEPKNE